eukprot:CAMPEP_0175761808 /NCGR_PEP_ID=MMETSP0097-20121207/66861_1 /TAXON_ID=311494 /ORGANISM="Alexandrium monilatum, Strain CCMP3105" /LENGTH=220 /DNA_ID=CAMNT_0017071415 /DNA_START=15 /DNA_END=673 /DNA_ORIENTATION=+
MVQQQEEDSDDEDQAAGSGLSAAAPPFVPRGLASRASWLRMLVLCGLPGSGKSTLAARLRAELGWEVVNQDALGSRQACMKAARDHLRSPGGRVVIDRCNADVSQRAVWVQLALQEFGLGALEIGCVWLDVPAEECDRRVLGRFGHRTLPPQASSLRVIRGFAASWEPPTAEEGFARLWRLASALDSEAFWAELRTARESGEGRLAGNGLDAGAAGPAPG